MDTPYVSVHLGSVGSTQDEARGRFAGGPVLVTADQQTEGRGRSGNRWQQAPRAVTASLAFVPDWPAVGLPRLTLVAGLAAVDAVGGAVRLAWPNDLVVGEEKVGGLLAEAAGGVVVVGLGLNLWWPEPMDGATALCDEDPGSAASAAVAASWAETLLARSGAGLDAWGRAEYLAACATLGREITWEPDGAGRAVGVSGDGGLEVETGDGMVVLRAGAVRRVRPS